MGFFAQSPPFVWEPVWTALVTAPLRLAVFENLGAENPPTTRRDSSNETEDRGFWSVWCELTRFSQWTYARNEASRGVFPRALLKAFHWSCCVKSHSLCTAADASAETSAAATGALSPERLSLFHSYTVDDDDDVNERIQRYSNFHEHVNCGRPST